MYTKTFVREIKHGEGFREKRSHEYKAISNPLPGTNKYWYLMRNHGRDPCWVQTYDPEVTRQTPYPLGHWCHIINVTLC